MHDIDEKIVRASKQLPAPAADDHPTSVWWWRWRRLGSRGGRGVFSLRRLETGVAAPPMGLTPAPDDARGRRGLPRGGLTLVARVATQREELSAPGHPLPRSFHWLRP